MLRDIYVIKDLNVLYHIQFGTSLDWEKLYPLIQSLSLFDEKSADEKITAVRIEKFQVTYSSDNKNRMIFIFISDLTDAIDDLEKQLRRAREEFTLMFEDLINISTNQANYASFNPIAEMIHQNLRPKIAIVGFPGVGKTTICKLIRADEIPTEHIPTITGDILTIKIGKLHFHLWDFAGQEQYSFLWPQFIQNSDAVLVITDSTLQNIDQSKFFLDLAKKEVPLARLYVIANKQDLPEALDPKKIERLLSFKTYGIIAKDPENRAKMIQIIGEILHLSPQISPLIRPLLDRDKAVKEAEDLLIVGDFEGAIQKFKTIAALCRELGDDRLSIEFMDRAKLIESKLKFHKDILPAKPELPAEAVDSKFTPIPEPPSKVDQKAQKIAKPNSLDIPEIPLDSKPIHLEKGPSEVKHEVKSFSTILIPSSQYIKIGDQFNFIERNIQYLLSNNYLQIDLHTYKKDQLLTIFSNYAEIPLSNFFKAVKTKINYGKVPLFPNISLPTEDTPIAITKPLIKPESSSKGIPIDMTTITELIAPERLNEILNNEKLGIKEKIIGLKDKLTALEMVMTSLKDNLEKKIVSKKDYDEFNNKLREHKRKIQDLISDLSIQELKQFEVSFPK